MRQRRPSRREVLRTASALVAAGASGLAPARAEVAHASIDAALRTATSTKEIPGVVAMAANDRDIIYEGVFGARRLGQGPAMTRDTVFRVASMIKTDHVGRRHAARRTG